MEREFYIIKDENGTERKYAINSQEEKDDFFNNAKTNNKKVFDQSGNAIDFNNIPRPGKSQGTDQSQNNQQQNTESSSENTSSDSQLNNTDSKIEKSSENVVEIGDASKGKKTSMLSFLKNEIEKDNIRVEEAESKLKNIPEITKPIKNETELAEKLTNQYIEFGFEFAEANYLGQTVKMISPDGKHSIKIHLNKLDKSQKLIKDFFKKHYDPNAQDITPTKESVKNQVEKTRKESEKKTKTDIDVLASNFNPEQEKTDKENLLNQIKNKKYYTYNPSGETKEERVNEFNAYDAVPAHIEEYRKHKVTQYNALHKYKNFYDPNFDTSISDDDILMSPDFMKFVKKKHGIQGDLVTKRMGLDEIEKYNNNRKTQKDNEAVRLVSKEQFRKFLSEKKPPEKFDEQLWNRGLQGEGGYFKNPEYLKIENENKKRIGEYLSKYNQIQQNPNYSEEERLTLQNELKSEYDLLANSLHGNILQENKVENITKQETEETRNLTKATKKYLEKQNLKLGKELAEEGSVLLSEKNIIEAEFAPIQKELVKINNELKSTQPALNKLNKKYNINFKEDEEGNKIYNLDYINEGIEKINKKYKDLPKTEEELKALLDKKVDEVKAKYDLTDPKQVEKANKEVTEYQQNIQDQLNTANDEINTYTENELNKIRQYEKEKDLIISKHNNNLKLHKEKYNDYLSFEKKYNEINAKLDGFQDTKLVLDLSLAENRKRLTAFGDGEWWNIKSKEVLGNFAQNFIEAAGAIYDIGDRFTDNLVDIFVEDKDSAQFLKTVKAHMIPLGHYFDEDSMGAVTDKKTGLKISMYDEDKFNFDKSMALANERIKQPLSWEDLKTNGDGADWAEYFISHGVSQVPVLLTIASTGGYALPLLGLNSAGGKYKELIKEKNLYEQSGGLYGQDLSYGQITLNAGVTGLFEGGSEYFTGRIFSRTIKALAATPKPLVQRGFINHIASIFKPKNLLHVGGEWVSEGASEVLAQAGSNMADIYINGDKTVNVLDGWQENFVNGSAFAAMLQSPRIYANAIAPFTSNNKAVLGNIARSLNDVAVDISDLKNFGPKYRDLSKKEREKQIEELENKHVQLVTQYADITNTDIKRIDLLSSNEKKTLLNINKSNLQDQELINKTLNDKRLNDGTRDQRIKDIEKRINNRNNKKQNILDKYPPEVVNKNYKNQMQNMQQMANMVAKMGGPTISIQQLTNEKYQQAVKEIESKKQDMSKSEIEARTSELEALYDDYTNIIDNSKNKKDVEAAKKKRAEITNELGVGINILKSNSAGVMSPIIEDGKITGMNILINKDAVVDNGMFNTGAHEFIHATFANTLKGDPAMRQVLGGQLQNIMDGKGITFKPGKEAEFKAKISQYRQDQQGEEMMAVMSEMLIKGDISINNSVSEKIAGVFRRFSQNYLGYDIKFDSQQDIKNFLTDYSKSFKNNKPSKAIARMIAEGANGKIFKDARTPEQIKDESMFSLAVQKNLKSNPDLRQDIDSAVQNNDGSSKHLNNEDFKASPEYIEAFNKITESRLLDGLIQQGMTDKGLPGEALRDFTRKVKEELGIRYLKNFDLDKNDSLFGWLTGVSGGAGMSIIYRAKGDVMKQYVKEGRAQDVSIDKPISEAGTIADVIEGDINQETKDAFETEEIILTRETETEVQGTLVKKALNFSDQTITTIENLARDVDYSNKSLNYKSVKDNLTKKDGILYDALDAVSNEIGIDANRIIKNQDLNNKQRTAAQKYIVENADTLIKLLPEGQDQSGQATGVANTKLGQFYVKGERAKMKTGATAAGLATQTKRTDITKEEFLNVFGVNPDGTFQKGTKADGAIRALVTQVATTVTNQELRMSGNAGARLKDGMSDAMYSLTPELQDITTQVVKSFDTASYEIAREDLLKTPNGEKIANFLDQMLFENNIESPGGYNDQVSKYMPGLFKDSKTGKKKIYTGPKLSKKSDTRSDKGIWGKPIDDLAINTAATISTLHPSISTQEAIYAFGFKDSGAFKINGKQVVIDGDPAVTLRTPADKYYPALSNINRMTEQQALKERNDIIKSGLMTEAEFDAMENSSPMEMKGFIGKTITSIYSETDLNKKRDMLKEALPQIQKINDGNRAKMKYLSIKMKQAYDAGKLTMLDTYLINKFQTNIVEGTRALSSLHSMYLIEGKQIGQMKKPPKQVTRNKKRVPNPNYDSQLKEYYDSWKTCKEFDKVTKIAKKKFPKAKGQELVDKTISLMRPKNEHLVGSAITHARRAGYTLGDSNITPDNIANNHETFFGPVWITDLFDRKLEVDGKLIDNKVSLEGENRLIKFAGGNQANIYHVSGDNIADFKVKKELAPIYNDLQSKKIKNTDTLNSLIPESDGKLMGKDPVEVKGMSVFDFDDTLGITKSGVRVKMPNIDGLPKPKRKVIFLAGGAGSGKSNVVKKLNLEKQGFKIVNSDISLEWLKKNSGLPADMRDLTKAQRSTLGKLSAESRKIARRKMMKYKGEGNGVVVDGTGGSIKSMTNLVNEFKDKGYDISMLYVETSLNTALERNRARKERSLLDKIVQRNHEAVQNNKPAFKDMFGNRFMQVKTDNLEIGDPMPKNLVSKMDDFVSGYEKRRLDATEFAEQGETILEQGGEFDFSEFNQVVEGRPGPLLDKALQRAKKYGTKDMFVLTARPPKSAEAIQQFLKSQGLDIPLKNITGLANSTGDAKAEWMLGKFKEGYNDMYFADDAMQNVTAVKEVLDQLDIKSDVVQAKLKQSNRLVDNSDTMQSKIIEPSQNIDMDFNEMLERKKGMDAKKRISGAEARVRGRDIGRFDFYIPPSAEDFKGLLYYFLGKGKQGDADMKFFSDKLLKPFAAGIRTWNTYKQSMANDFRSLKKQSPNVVKILNDLVPGTNFTNDSAIRVYLWNKAGKQIPNISKNLEKELVRHISNNPALKSFAEALAKISRTNNNYTEPGQNWVIGSIARDLSETVNKVGRKQFLSEWINNKDIIFSPDNINKIEALYGTRYREALENILYRMENGGNRVMSNDRDTNFMVNWINGAVGSIMFFNMRSAILQTISAVNFVNFSDNNIFKATAAFANQPQFWKDFVMLFNSDQLKQRRAGLQTDVSASELVKSFKENGNTYGAVVNYLLEKGFTPTQIADSVAIAFGGASFYRNRFKKYKKQGMTDAQANEQAMLDFQEIAEETQQSSREDLVSKQQASILGRIILAFQNVTMQYGRLTKKALSDLVNRRGDTKTNISKILYYGAVQNIVFASLQSALAFMMFGDEEEEVIKEKEVRVANTILDSFLRGTGIYGALASTLKNVALEWHVQSQKAKEGFKKDEIMDIAQEALNLSPPIGAKVRKLIQAYKMKEFGRTATRDKLKYRLENPKLAAAASLIEGVTNIPLARLLNKANNLEEAITGQHETWKRVAMALGWSRWELGLKDEEVEAAREEVKEEKKVEREIKREEKKEEKRKEKEEQKKKEEEEKKKKGIKTVRCSGIRSNGTRCKITGETNKKKFLCVHHAEFKDGMDRDGDGKKEYRCTATKSNGKRCKNKTENKNKKCYAHQ